MNNPRKTFLPPASVYLFAVTLPFFEVTAGSLLILGLFTRFAAALGGLLVTALTIGLTISGDAHGVALNLVYAMALFILLYLVDENELSLDRLRKRS
ncbi:MAG: DoxX family membrane protein [Acidobacteria bacterium]|nr:DoxX family membrane protein [Acidobacteriota bacterium]